jgi:hypothetical protein
MQDKGPLSVGRPFLRLVVLLCLRVRFQRILSCVVGAAIRFAIVVKDDETT